MHNNTFASLLSDLATVYTRSDTHGLLSRDVVAVDFHENNPEDVVRGHAAYIAENPDVKTTSVAERLSNVAYETPYALFHDLSVCCGSEIVKYDVGSPEYSEIDAFFHFAADLLLREVAKLGLSVYKKKEHKEDDEDDLLELFRDDYEKISSSKFASNGEFVTYIHRFTESAVPTYHSTYTSQAETEPKTVVQPLFSGLVKRSVLDPRNTVVPEPWSLTKAVDAGVNAGGTATIKSFNSVACKIPLPSQASAQVLDSFFHPNWYTIESPKWLQYKQKTLKPALNSTLVRDTAANELRVLEKKSNIISLGPAVDSRNSVLSEDLKRKIWYSNIGRKEVEKIQKRSGEPAENGSGQEVSDDEASVGSDHEGQEQATEHVTDTQSDPMALDLNKTPQNAEVKLVNVALYDPEAAALITSLKQDKEKIAKNPHEIQKVISLSLLRLNKLRHERFLHSSQSATPSPTERALYKKTVRLLSLLASSNAAHGKATSLQLKKNIPVLLNDYQGVLPGPMAAKVVPATKSGRLGGIKGPFKKKR